MSRDPFFIGYLKPPAGLRRFLPAVAVLFLAVFAASAYVASATQGDPGDGAFQWGWGRQVLTGRLQAEPVPVLHISESERFPAGTAVVLGGPGKVGALDRAKPLDGQVVVAEGVMLTRGDLLMLQVRGGADCLRPAEAGTAAPPLPAPDAAGRWRLTGEICDGKCYTGAMRPGTGLAHKACANLCLIGGQPPIFVSAVPLNGHTFFAMGDTEGRPVANAVLNDTGTLVTIEGRVEMRGAMPYVLVDPATIEPAS